MTVLMLDEMMLECLRNCTECHNMCLQTAVSPDVVGKIGAADLALLLNCADLCRACADVLNTASPYHRPVCRACSEICEACALMCDQTNIEVMRMCASICRTCAGSCRRMTEH